MTAGRPTPGSSRGPAVPAAPPASCSAACAPVDLRLCPPAAVLPPPATAGGRRPEASARSCPSAVGRTRHCVPVAGLAQRLATWFISSDAKAVPERMFVGRVSRRHAFRVISGWARCGSVGWRRRGERKRTLPLAALVTRSDGTLSQRDRAALNRRRRRGPALMGRSTGPRFVSARASRRRRRGTCSARIRGASALAEAQSPDQKRGWRIPGKVPGPGSRLRSAVSAVVREGSANGARSSQRPTSGPRLA